MSKKNLLFGNYTQEQMDEICHHIDTLLAVAMKVRALGKLEGSEFKELIEVIGYFDPKDGEVIKFIMKEVFDLDDKHQDLFISMFMTFSYLSGE